MGDSPGHALRVAWSLCRVAAGRFLSATASAGLTVAWEEDGLQQGRVIHVPEDVYDRGCVKDVEEGLEVSTGPEPYSLLLLEVMPTPSQAQLSSDGLCLPLRRLRRLAFH